MSTCPGRNYCNPSQTNCGNTNLGATWFATTLPKSCDCTNPCLLSPPAIGQSYCDGHAAEFGGGTFQTYCYQSGDMGTCMCQSDRICIKSSWDSTNKLLCCTGKYNDVVHCDPSWCPNNLDTCSDVLSTYCAQEQHVAFDPVCVQFCGQTENKAYCDMAMQTYCTSNPSDKLCSCLNSAIPHPSCFDDQCISGGYQNAEMVMDAMNCSTHCSDFITCVNTGRCNRNNPDYIRYCEHPSPTPSFEGIPIWIWIVGGVILFILIIALIYFLWRRSRH